MGIKVKAVMLAVTARMDGYFQMGNGQMKCFIIAACVDQASVFALGQILNFHVTFYFLHYFQFEKAWETYQELFIVMCLLAEKFYKTYPN